MSQEHVNRRSMLRGCGGIGLAAFGLGCGAGTASAAVSASPRFDLTKPSYDLFRHKRLHDVTVQQGFAFDGINKRLFVAQRRNGTDTKAGDLCITQLDFAGNYVSYMHLSGFGHGVAFGVEPRGTESWLWTEVDANANGYGTRLARFKFVKGGSLSHASSAIAKYSPVPGAVEYTCSIDPVHENLVLRHHKYGAKHIAVYAMADAKAGDFSRPKAYFKQPSIPGTMQGYTAYGQYLYCLTGNAYSASNPAPGNAHLVSVNLNAGVIAQGPVLTKAGGTLEFREPEGLAVYRTDAGQSRLFLGFASGAAGNRRSNLFYKNVLL
ncbi:teichoic acid biosynthesis protein C [Streptomyces pluripotens]|uniref:Teichoic acid biosynthesis protein C n=2 Tax=Streptomyces TaxID=1883 RepID=A0A221P6T4_9ACTN|nr:teichoic acid biosynthesis protein C [Streptomyces pluripotens]ASN28013.1 teichoic acid biosynthesis protein C [Streptomyces pluripotens]